MRWEKCVVLNIPSHFVVSGFGASMYCEPDVQMTMDHAGVYCREMALAAPADANSSPAYGRKARRASEVSWDPLESPCARPVCCSDASMGCLSLAMVVSVVSVSSVMRNLQCYARNPVFANDRVEGSPSGPMGTHQDCRMKQIYA